MGGGRQDFSVCCGEEDLSGEYKKSIQLDTKLPQMSKDLNIKCPLKFRDNQTASKNKNICCKLILLRLISTDSLRFQKNICYQ